MWPKLHLHADAKEESDAVHERPMALRSGGAHGPGKSRQVEDLAT